MVEAVETGAWLRSSSVSRALHGRAAAREFGSTANIGSKSYVRRNIGPGRKGRCAPGINAPAGPDASPGQEPPRLRQRTSSAEALFVGSGAPAGAGLRNAGV